MPYDFGLRLRELRKSKHWSQRQLAKKLNISAAAISRYENNTMTPSATVLSDMASLFRVSANYILGIEEHGVIHIGTLTEVQKKMMKAFSEELRRLNR